MQLHQIISKVIQTSGPQIVHTKLCLHKVEGAVKGEEKVEDGEGVCYVSNVRAVPLHLAVKK